MRWWKSTSFRPNNDRRRARAGHAWRDFVQRRLVDPFVNGMNGKSGRVAAALLFTLAAIIGPLAVAATRGDNQPNGTVTQCGGPQLGSPFSDYYSCVDPGSVPGLPTPYGGS